MGKGYSKMIWCKKARQLKIAPWGHKQAHTKALVGAQQPLGLTMLPCRATLRPRLADAAWLGRPRHPLLGGAQAGASGRAAAGRRHTACGGSVRGGYARSTVPLPLRHLVLAQRDLPVQGVQAWRRGRAGG